MKNARTGLTCQRKTLGNGGVRGVVCGELVVTDYACRTHSRMLRTPARASSLLGGYLSPYSEEFENMPIYINRKI